MPFDRLGGRNKTFKHRTRPENLPWKWVIRVCFRWAEVVKIYMLEHAKVNCDPRIKRPRVSQFNRVVLFKLYTRHSGPGHSFTWQKRAIPNPSITLFTSSSFSLWTILCARGFENVPYHVEFFALSLYHSSHHHYHHFESQKTEIAIFNLR